VVRGAITSAEADHEAKSQGEEANTSDDADKPFSSPWPREIKWMHLQRLEVTDMANNEAKTNTNAHTREGIDISDTRSRFDGLSESHD
jgi:hypothetical protein